MTLREVLTEAMRALGDMGCDHVSIARRGQSHRLTIKFVPTGPAGHQFRTVSSLVSDDRPSWFPHIALTVEDAIADDWVML